MKLPGRQPSKVYEFLTPGTLVLYKCLERGGRKDLSGQRARVMRDFDCDEDSARAGNRMYQIRFAQGEITNAYAKELTKVPSSTAWRP
jgi:hypothetical protein